jgi:radical SAM protein with 4Fe4S-binding SPASM domain
MTTNKSLREIGASLVDTDYPRQITFEISAHCNLQCIMCPHPDMTRRKGFMDEDLYRKCIDEVAAEAPETEVWLADHGESLIAGGALVERIRYAKFKDLPKVFLNTNGMLLDRPLAAGIVSAGLDMIVFGIDAYRAETYERIRVGGKLDAVIQNIDGLLQEKRLHQSAKPEVWVQFIEMEENWGERDEFQRFWTERGVGVKIRRKLSWGACIESPDLRVLETERIACPWLINLMHILWDGSVCRCSGDHECNYLMGNVRDQTIGGIWRGELRKERQIHLQGRFDLVNQQCQQCIDWKVGAAEKYLPVI